jgi:AraC-like DNA-binding protein
MHMPTNGVTVVAAFRPLGAAQFLALPLHEVFGAMVPLAEFVHPADIREVEDHLVAARDARAHAAILDAFLVRRLRAGGEDSLARAAVDRITMAGGNIRIQTLARELGTSVDPLEKRFRRVVGASPKQFASIVRFRRAIAAQGSGRTLAEVAHASGYFDQSHFVREFRAFTGEPPSRFLDTFCGRESHSVLLRGSGRGVVPKVGVRRRLNHNL